MSGGLPQPGAPGATPQRQPTGGGALESAPGTSAPTSVSGRPRRFPRWEMPSLRNPEHVHRTRIALPLPIDQVFTFFSMAENLEWITPPELNFRIVTPVPITLERGALIDYRLSLFGVPFRWRTEITVWDPPYEFVDEQLRGPYAQWIHRHRFREEEGKTVIEDEVRYRLPVPLAGEVAYPVVKRQVARIFRHREARIRELLLPKAGQGPEAAELREGSG